MYTIKAICEDMNREEKEIKDALIVLKLDQSKHLSESDRMIIINYFSVRKQALMDTVRYLIRIYPFSEERDVAGLMGRPTSYARWIISELTFVDEDLAETDDDELFYVNPETIKELKKRQDYY